jgi:hypothetical protein
MPEPPPSGGPQHQHDKVDPPAPRRRHPGAWYRELNAAQKAGFIGAIVVALITTVPPLVGSGRDKNESPSTLPSTGGSVPSVSPTTSLTPETIPTDLFDGLRSPNPDVRRNSVSVLGVRLNAYKEAEIRRAILQRLAAFISDRAPGRPRRDSYGYCLQDPPPRYPTEVTLALQAIGSRDDITPKLRIDLSNVNLAYASLQDLNLSYVIFDGAIMCRTFLNDSQFTGASFIGTNLRFVVMPRITGLAPGQLRRVYTLYKAELPPNLAADSDLRSRVRTDPELR